MNLPMNLINGVDAISHLPAYHQTTSGRTLLLDIPRTTDVPLQRENPSERVRHPLLW